MRKQKTHFTVDELVAITRWMARGHTPSQVASKLDISTQWLQELIHRPDLTDLKEAFEVGLTKWVAHMEKMGYNMIPAQHGKVEIWKMLMQQYGGYKDSKELTVKRGAENLTDAELEEQIRLLKSVG